LCDFVSEERKIEVVGGRVCHEPAILQQTKETERQTERQRERERERDGNSGSISKSNAVAGLSVMLFSLSILDLKQKLHM